MHATGFDYRAFMRSIGGEFQHVRAVMSGRRRSTTRPRTRSGSAPPVSALQPDLLLECIPRARRAARHRRRWSGLTVAGDAQGGACRPMGRGALGRMKASGCGSLITARRASPGRRGARLIGAVEARRMRRASGRRAPGRLRRTPDADCPPGQASAGGRARALTRTAAAIAPDLAQPGASRPGLTFARMYRCAPCSELEVDEGHDAA